jgi:signal transduction histidine kinase
MTVDSVAEALPADRVTLVIMAPEEQEVTHFVRGGPGFARALPVSFEELRQGLTGWVLRELKPALSPKDSPDSRESLEVQKRRAETNSGAIIVAPLSYQDKTLGTITAINRQDEPNFTGRDVELMTAIANQVAIAIENAQLYEALRQRTVELQAQNEELDAFAHTVAHDLQGPLGPIIGFASLLNEEHPTLSDDEIRAFAQTIARNGRKMSSIINELLLLAGVRKMNIEPKPLDMAGIVAEALQRLTGVIEEHQATIILPAVWPVALGYGPWIEEVWANYLSNAIKYGGRPPRLELGATPYQTSEGSEISQVSSSMVRFWVRDNGPGLTSKEQARLFTQFTRLHQVQAKGHGLGLSIVQRIIKKLGGQVGVESQMGQGSVFSFTLPSSGLVGSSR